MMSLPNANGATPWIRRSLYLAAVCALEDIVAPASTLNGVLTILGFVGGMEAVAVTSQG